METNTFISRHIFLLKNGCQSFQVQNLLSLFICWDNGVFIIHGDKGGPFSGVKSSDLGKAVTWNHGYKPLTSPGMILHAPSKSSPKTGIPATPRKLTCNLNIPPLKKEKHLQPTIFFGFNNVENLRGDV